MIPPLLLVDRKLSLYLWRWPEASEQFDRPVFSMRLPIYRGIPVGAWASLENLSALGFSDGLVGDAIFPRLIAHHTIAPFQSPVHSLHGYFLLGGCPDPSQLFSYIDLIKFRPHSYLMDPSNKMVVDNVTIPPLDFAYLVPCCPSILIYQGWQRVYIKVCPPDRFC